jgi:hypothetical protein
VRARIAIAAAIALAGTFAVSAGAAYEQVRGNPADRLADLPIDPYRYDHATRCRRSPAPGMLAFERWMQQNAGGASWGIMRCSRLGRDRYSLHAEGRALDWALNVHNARDRREATRIISLLLAPDRAGNPHALARRMGVQEIIWDCRSWWSGSAEMDRYSACYDPRGRPKRVDESTAHRNHIHFGLNWPGARMQSTFWVRSAR